MSSVQNLDKIFKQNPYQNALEYLALWRDLFWIALRLEILTKIISIIFN